MLHERRYHVWVPHAMRFLRYSSLCYSLYCLKQPSGFLKHITVSLETCYAYFEFVEKKMSEWIWVCVFILLAIMSLCSLFWKSYGWELHILFHWKSQEWITWVCPCENQINPNDPHPPLKRHYRTILRALAIPGLLWGWNCPTEKTSMVLSALPSLCFLNTGRSWASNPISTIG